MIRSFESAVALRCPDRGPSSQDPGGFRARAGLIENELRAAFFDAEAALFGLAGLGRCELAPRSDIDIMVYAPRGAEVEAEARAFFRALWDRGLPISPVFRGPDELRRCMEEDLAGATAILEGRVLAGSPAAAAEALSYLREDFLPSLGERFLRYKLEEAEERRRAPSALLELNQPELKSGQGGLRDVQLIALIDGLFGALDRPIIEDESRVLPGLLRAWPGHRGRLAEGAEQELERAIALLEAARAAVHEHAAGDRIDRAIQGLFVESLTGAPADAASIAETLGQLFRARRRIDTLCRTAIRSARARIGAEAPRRELLVGERIVARGDSLDFVEDAPLEDVVELFSIFELARRTKRFIGEATLDRLREEGLPRLPAEEFQKDELAQRFRALLGSASHVAPTLRALHRCGFLGRLLPEFQALEGLAQVSSIHAFTVDEHTLRALEALEGLGPDRDRREAKMRLEMLYDTPHRDLLRLGLLLHDVGKTEGFRDHCERGGAAIDSLGDRLGLNPFEREHIRCIVVRHLVLSRLSRTRRLLDEGTRDEVLDAVERKPLRLEHLYLATSADMAAVEESSFTRWEDVLLTRLFERARATWDGAATPDSGPELVDALVEAGPLEGRDELRAHLEMCPDTYLAETDPTEAARDLALIHACPDEGFSLGLAADESWLRITIVSRKWPRHLVESSGALSGLGLDILDAASWARDDEVQLSRFVIQSPAGASAAEGFEKLEERLSLVLARIRSGEIVVGALVREASSRFPRRPLLELEPPPRVVIDPDISADRTVVEVSARDRQALLHSLLSVFDAEGLTVHFAKISTQGARATDTFYVTRSGAKLAPPEADQLAEALAAVA